jgi:hypothetical protein
MPTTELDTLILRNLADLDATARRLDQIDEIVWSAVDALTERWAREHRWTGLFDIEGRGLWVTPAKWRKASENEDSPDVRFWFEVAAHEPLTHFDLSDLCGIGGSRYGFRMYQDLLGKADWKVLARKHIALFQSLGLQLDAKASPFMEIIVDIEKLAISVETGDFDEALQPIAHGLDRLINVDKVLGRILFKPSSPAKAQAGVEARKG